jgi:hypothetical protein
VKNTALAMLALLLMGLGFALNKSQILNLLKVQKLQPIPVESVPVETEPDFNVEDIKKLGELGSTSVSSEVAIPLKRKNIILGGEFGSTNFIFYAQAEATASIDLNELTEDSVKMSGDLIEIQLPHPKIKNVAFRIGKSDDSQLQEQAETQSIKKMSKSICTSGIMQKPIAVTTNELIQILLLTQSQKVKINQPKISLEECLKIIANYPKS